MGPPPHDIKSMKWLVMNSYTRIKTHSSTKTCITRGYQGFIYNLLASF